MNQQQALQQARLRQRQAGAFRQTRPQPTAQPSRPTAQPSRLTATAQPSRPTAQPSRLTATAQPSRPTAQQDNTILGLLALLLL